jgi:hypothetical protein
MKLLNTYEDRDQAEEDLTKIIGSKRLASERDDTSTIYNLFGEPTWRNFYNLNMFNLKELETLLAKKTNLTVIEFERYKEIIKMLEYVSTSYGLMIPSHWLNRN